MRVHELKTDPLPFSDCFDSKKLFEIRFNDRDFQEGDILHLRETTESAEDMLINDLPIFHTGRELIFRVTHILKGGYGLKEGWVIMSVKFLTYQDMIKG